MKWILKQNKNMALCPSGQVSACKVEDGDSNSSRASKNMARSSSGLGRQVFNLVTRVRFSYGLQNLKLNENENEYEHIKYY